MFLSTAIALGLLAISPSETSATPFPASIAVYGEQPATFRDGVTPFPASGSTFQYQQDSDDPVTRLKFTAVPGFKNGLGRWTGRLSSFGKYILFGNAQTLSLGGFSTDLRIGVFDSETRQYCDRIISSDPQLATAVPQLVTGNPGARQSRILLATGTIPDRGGAGAFGYVSADLDSSDPCAWPAVMTSAAQLNAGFALADQLCPNDTCLFDTVALLAHEDVVGNPFGRDYVALGNHFGGPNGVVRIDGNGIAVVATYRIPLFATPNSGGACYASGPARLGTADFQLPDTRPPNDWRFLFSFDSNLVQFYQSTPPVYCAAPYPFCPLDIAPDGHRGACCPGCGGCDTCVCPGGGSSGTCVQAYCKRTALGWRSCSSDSDCIVCSEGNCLDVGPCQNTCLLKSPLFTCKTSDGGGSHRQCVKGEPDNCPISGENCSGAGPGVPSGLGPSQEYSFDKTTNKISPTSPMFFYSNQGGGVLTGVTPTGAAYGSDRSAWVFVAANNIGVYRTKITTDNCTVDGQTVHVSKSGEHCYYDPTNPTMAVVVPTDQVLSFERTPAIPYEPTTVQVGSAMYMADTGSLQFAQKYLQAWFTVADTTYKVGFAFAPPDLPLTDPLARSTLPVQPRRCSVSLRGCNTDADCLPDGGTCTALAEKDAGGRDAPVPLLPASKFVEFGGAPRSLWIASGYKPGIDPFFGGLVVQTDVFLERIPVGFNLPDNISAVRPSVAWSGDRLWLVAEHNGELKYRIRDDGVWSGWYSLAPNNITPYGGGTIIADATRVMVFARDSAGVVYAKGLTSSIGCTAGSCTWDSWVSLPTSVTTDVEPAATFAGGNWYIAMRNRNDSLVYATNVFGLGYRPWFLVGTQTTDAAPSLTYQPSDQRVWIAVREPGSPPVMKYTRIQGTASEPWAIAGAAGAQTWGTAPAIVSDGTAIRIFVSQQDYPNQTWQTANDGSGWTDWRVLLSGAGATSQPAAANVNGEIDLVTYWSTNGIQETFIP